MDDASIDRGIDGSFVSLGSHASGSSASELESDIGREALREICCSVLSRVLDLSDNKLEVLLGGDESSTASGSHHNSGGNVAKNIANKFKSISHKLKYDEPDSYSPSSADISTLPFGVPITEEAECIIVQLINHMEKFTTEEGLFRKSGSKSRVEQLATALETTSFQSIVNNDAYSPHDFACVFKQYFSALPEPLMTSRHMEAYRQAAELSNDGSRTLSLQLLVLLLPPTHHNVLYQLLQFLSVVAHSQENKMDAHNLSVVFAPTLFFNMKQSDSVIPELIPKAMSLLQFMIKNCTDIFEIPSEVRVIAERYMKRKSTQQTTAAAASSTGEEDVDIPLDVCTSYCQQSAVTSDQFHQNGKDLATAELASLYEYVRKMPDGPQKQHFLKKFGSTTKMAKLAGSPAPYTVCKKSKENFTPKIKLQKGVGSHEITTPMRPSFNNRKIKMDQKTVQVYATPLKPSANLTQYQRLETDV